MTCPDCERYKASAAMWRNKAYELGGTPLPWDADEMIKKAVSAEREACARIVDEWSNSLSSEPEMVEIAAAIRARDPLQRLTNFHQEMEGKT